MLNRDARKDQEGFIFLGKPETWAGINTAVLANEIKAFVKNNAVIISEGWSLIEAAEISLKKRRSAL